MKLIKSNILLILVLITGLFLRSYHPFALFQYSHDQDLAGWFVRDVLISHHLRLIGQETSSHGIFIGPFFYYLQIPFYLLTRLDPAGALLLPIILGVFTIWSVYFVLKEIFNRNVGLVGALVYALSVLVIFTDREVDPTMPVMLWTVWYLFALSRILKNQKNAYVIIGFLVGLIWSLNLQLVILLPLILLAQIFSKKKINLNELFVGGFIAFLMNIPFIAFEVRHGFQQTKSLLLSLTTSKDYVAGTAIGFTSKLDRTMQLVYKNTTNLFGGNILNIDVKVIFWILVSVFLYLVWKKKINKKLAVLLFLWQVIYVLFFSKVSLNLSEYYLNGMNIIWILIAASGVNSLFQSRKLKIIGLLLIAVFIVVNLYSYIIRPVNADGYIERKAVLSYIKSDAAIHNYPCVSLSFITSPGNDLGYRYFTWELGLKTKPISLQVPVYSIVFPLSKVDKFDKSIGSLGVVKPDYKRYNDKVVQKACEGFDYTTTQPMFGFTK